MSRIYIKYLFFLGILLIANASNLYANSAYRFNNIEKTQHDHQIDISVDFKDNTVIYPNSQFNQNKLLFDIVEVQHEEIEEPSNSDEIESINSFRSALINAELFNWLSFQHKKNKYYNKRYFYQSSIKLHIRFKVFII